MVEIPLTQGKVAVIDDEDLPLVSQHSWYYHKASKSKTVGYAATRTNGHIMKMHRLLAGKDIDHINGDRLDNRRTNLRPATQQQNCCNRGVRGIGTSKYKGVCFRPRYTSPWEAELQSHGVRVYRHRFATEQAAALAYDQAARRYHGEFAWLNADHFEELRCA